MNNRYGHVGRSLVRLLPVGQLCLAAAMALSVFGLGCGGHHYYRVYDPYYTDYHVWNHDEVVYYNQWSTETHRDSHRDFRKIPPGEQKEYWTWRHNHGDHH
ncbi:MAG: hypothetical protein WB729_00290 [Candidatus Sulfotelmatobacter sp.]